MEWMILGADAMAHGCHFTNVCKVTNRLSTLSNNMRLIAHVEFTRLYTYLVLQPCDLVNIINLYMYHVHVCDNLVFIPVGHVFSAWNRPHLGKLKVYGLWNLSQPGFLCLNILCELQGSNTPVTLWDVHCQLGKKNHLGKLKICITL